ncbi:hypothetical protein T439DRAFT_380276 [Meredithblackwellia eburnea MCA 4105]
MGMAGGYTKLPQNSTDEHQHDTTTTVLPTTTTTTSTTLNQNPSRDTALHVDILFKQWTNAIAHRIKLKRRKSQRTAKLKRSKGQVVPILVSQFTDDPSPRTTRQGSSADLDTKGKSRDRGSGDDDENQKQWHTLDHLAPMTRETFDRMVDKVRLAIERSVHPRLNSKGSSGSYFARDEQGNTVGIFKPRDEEPYGAANPKMIKWIHRNFLSKVIPFGRSCLIPGLSYLSESAASLLDRRLESHIVPRTEVVSLSSPAFYYDWIVRDRAKRKKKGLRDGELPDKPGSFQVFVRGFQDASEFLRKHPYPGRSLLDTFDPSPHRPKHVNIFSPLSLRCLCGTAGAEVDDDDDEDGEEGSWSGSTRRSKLESPEAFQWTEETMASFREELEKLIIFDFLIRNTDRGLDNFMIKVCRCSNPSSSSTSNTVKETTADPFMTEVRPPAPIPSPSIKPCTPTTPSTHIHIAAIDNSLAFPHQHPLGWRTYVYGWLYLPASLLDQPWSTKTREHYLPLLTSKEWWETTTMELRDLFGEYPEDFREDMFGKQMSVIKGGVPVGGGGGGEHRVPTSGSGNVTTGRSLSAQPTVGGRRLRSGSLGQNEWQFRTATRGKGGRRWLGRSSETLDELEEGGSEVDSSPKELVVIERLESVEEKPRWWLPNW